MPNRESYKYAQIIEQVDKISKSAVLRNSPTLCQFLRFVVVETLDGRGEQIKEYTIGTLVLGRKSDFDPQFDAIVRIHAGRLRRALNEYYLNDGKTDSLLIIIPKGGYVPTFTKNDFKKVPVEVPKKVNKSKKPVLAVKPFRNLSNDASYDFFCSSLGEFVSTELARFQELSLVSYSLCESASHKTKDVAELMANLGARYLLTGSVFIGNENLRISLQLSVGDSGRQLWSSSIDRKLTEHNLFDVEEEVVNLITASLGGYYGVIYRYEHEEEKVETNKERSAVGWYYQFMKRLDRGIFDEACEALEIAVKADSDFSLAWAVLSEVYAIGALRSFQRVEHQMEEAITFALRAVKLDPQSQHAYQSLAFVCLLTKDKARFMEAAEKCIALNPRDAGFGARIGMFLILSGEYERGEKMLTWSLHINPFTSWLAPFSLCLYCYKQGEFQKALNWVESVDMPGIGWVHMLKAVSLAQLGMQEQSQKHISQFMILIPNIKLLGRSFLSSFLMDNDLIDKIIIGLEKAGLVFDKEQQPATR